MCVHLATNASVLNGPATFQKNVDTIHSLGRLLPIVEWTFIFIPLLFHMLLGVAFIRGGNQKTPCESRGGNTRYILQRWTGMVAAAFILFHVLTLHKLGLGQFDPHHASSSTAEALQSSIFFPIIYVVGVLSCVFHLANGLWTMGITWGIVGLSRSPGSSRANYVCCGVRPGIGRHRAWLCSCTEP